MNDFRINAQETARHYKGKMVGKRYRHFKGGIYLVTDIAVHSEDASLMVIYKNFHNLDLVWVRPLSMFLSEVDREKYPDVEQEYRFEELVERKNKFND